MRLRTRIADCFANENKRQGISRMAHGVFTVPFNFRFELEIINLRFHSQATLDRLLKSHEISLEKLHKSYESSLEKFYLSNQQLNQQLN